MEGLSAVAHFKWRNQSGKVCLLHIAALPGLEQGLPDLLSESRLPGRPAVELTGGREDYRPQQEVTGSKVTGQGKAVQGLNGEVWSQEKQEGLGHQQARG